jgi:hypothetical protein
LAIQNQTDRFRGAMDVIDRVPKVGVCGVDKLEIDQWTWK